MGEPRLFTQEDFTTMAWNKMELTIEKTKKLAASFMQHNVLDIDFRNAINRKRALSENFFKLFRTEPCTEITYCHDIKELFIKLEYPNNPKEWILFIDRSQVSLTAALVHVADKFPSIPIAYSSGMKATYASLQAIIMLTQYYDHKWRVCGDLKVVGVLMGLDENYVERQCFLCKWEPKENEVDNDYAQEWPTRFRIQLGKDYFIPRPLVRLEKRIILSTLQMKLGLLRNFTRKLPTDGDAHNFLYKVMDDLGLNSAKVSRGND